MSGNGGITTPRPCRASQQSPFRLSSHQARPQPHLRLQRSDRHPQEQGLWSPGKTGTIAHRVSSEDRQGTLGHPGTYDYGDPRRIKHSEYDIRPPADIVNGRRRDVHDDELHARISKDAQ